MTGKRFIYFDIFFRYVTSIFFDSNTYSIFHTAFYIATITISPSSPPSPSRHHCHHHHLAIIATITIVAIIAIIAIAFIEYILVK
tara:strand:+ start:271 stop:525 length:255 start_codon:yes stop_codon:yes gene_type:complete